MYTLDSDLIGILMAIFTFLIPVFSAVMERNRKKKRGESAENFPDNLEEGFQLFITPESDLEEEPDSGLGNEPEVVFQAEPELVSELEAVRETEVVPESELVPQTVVESVVTDEGKEREEVRKSLKERLKDNPKDAVLFSEILNPKFKEY